MILEKYIKNGYYISDPILNQKQIETLRQNLEEEFLKNNNKVQRKLNEFHNENLIMEIIKMYRSPSIKETIKILEKNYKKKFVMLPPFEIHKNYHVNLKEFHGWHRDCGGELNYNYCRKIIYSNNYFFSKIGVFLQKNGEYGGCIDIIKSSHKNFSKYKAILRKLKNIPLRLIIFIHKYFNNFYNLIPESFYMFFLNAKKLNPEKSSAVFFDSRIIHRGSPISKKKLKEVNYEKGKFQAFLPKELNKYSIYCQLGSVDSIDSYFHDRLKRKNNSDELKFWIEQAKFLSKYDKNMSEEIELALSSLKEKYKKFL